MNELDASLPIPGEHLPATYVNTFVVTVDNGVARIVFGEDVSKQGGSRVHPRVAVIVSLKLLRNMSESALALLADLDKPAEPERVIPAVELGTIIEVCIVNGNAASWERAQVIQVDAGTIVGGTLSDSFSSGFTVYSAVTAEYGVEWRLPEGATA